MSYVYFVSYGYNTEKTGLSCDEVTLDKKINNISDVNLIAEKLEKTHNYKSVVILSWKFLRRAK
jgi:hypothetical protein